MQKQGCTDSFPLTEKNFSVASQALTSHSQPLELALKAQVPNL